MNDIIEFLRQYWYILIPLLFIIFIVLIVLIRRGYINSIDVFGVKIDFKPAKPIEETLGKKLSEVNTNTMKKTAEIESKHLDDELVLEKKNGAMTSSTSNPNNVARKNTEAASKYSDDELASFKQRFYQCTKVFTDSAIEEIQLLKLTQETILHLIQIEFLSHLTYFRYDIQDYPLPVQKEFVVILDKVGENITIRGVKKASWNELELASWNSVLAMYRRATRYKYRTENDYVLRPEVVKMISDYHEDIQQHIIRHLIQYKNMQLFDAQPDDERGIDWGVIISNYHFVLRNALWEFSDNKHLAVYPQDMIDSILGRLKFKFPEEYKNILYYISSSILALQGIRSVLADVENNLISQEDGYSEIVLSLERSLQFLHKIILSVI